MLTGQNIYLRALNKNDAEARLKLQLRNRDFFEKFSMTRDRDYYTLDGQYEIISVHNENMNNDQSYNFGIFKVEDHTLVGTINLFQVIRGDLQSAFIGYFLDKENNGKGFATEAVRLIKDYAFSELKLHRIEAGVMPHNVASIRVLEKAGFHKEGIAVKNVRINGKWEDHQVLAVINPLD